MDFKDDEFHCSPGEWNLAVDPLLSPEKSLTVTVKDGGHTLAVWQESEFYGYEVDLLDHEGKMIDLEALPSEPKRSDIDHITLDGNVPLLVANNLYYVKYLFKEIAALSKTGSVTLFLCDRMPHANQFLELLREYLVRPLFFSKNYSVETPKDRNEIIIKSTFLRLRIDCCSWENLTGEYFPNDKMDDLVVNQIPIRYIWNDLLKDCLSLPKLSGVNIMHSSLKPRGLQAVCSAANLQELKLDYRGAFNMKLLLQGLGLDPSVGAKKRKRHGTGGVPLSQLKVLHLEKVKISQQDLIGLLKVLEKNLTVKDLVIDTILLFDASDVGSDVVEIASWNPLLQLLRHNHTLESVKFSVRQCHKELRPYSRFSSYFSNPLGYTKNLKEQLQNIMLQNRTLGTLELPVHQTSHPFPVKKMLELNYFGLRKFMGDQGAFEREELQVALELAVQMDTCAEDLRLVETLFCVFQSNPNLLEVFW